MLSDEEFYAAIQPHLRAKSAGQEGKITPKDASATWSNGGKSSDGVTESRGPNGPKLAITVSTVHKNVPARERAGGRWGNSDQVRSSKHSGLAWPIVVEDDILSPVDGIVILDYDKSYRVKITEVKHQVDHGPKMMHSVTFILSTLPPHDGVKMKIWFAGNPDMDGEFRTVDPKFDDLANDWMVRWMFRKQHGR